MIQYVVTTYFYRKSDQDNDSIIDSIIVQRHAKAIVHFKAAFCHSALGSVVRTRTCQVKSKSLAKKTRKTIQSHIVCSFETGEDCNLPPKEKTIENC